MSTLRSRGRVTVARRANERRHRTRSNADPRRTPAPHPFQRSSTQPQVASRGEDTAGQQAQQQAAYDQQQMEVQLAQQQAQIDAMAAQQAPAAPAAPAGKTMDQTMAELQQLGQLRDSGILTEQEFAVQKAAILAY